VFLISKERMANRVERNGIIPLIIIRSHDVEKGLKESLEVSVCAI
jgi:hypothetical protein